MRFDRVSYDLDLADDERCFYHCALQNTSRPMCFGVSDKALFIARERFLKLKAYTMERLPLEDVKEVILSRERGTWVWLKWALLFAFGIGSMIVIAIGLMASPTVNPGIGAVGPVFFTVVGLSMLVDNRWRLVLTIRTKKKDWKWRPSIFDKKYEVKALREGFLDACRYVHIPTRRLDLVNEYEIQAFWKWFKDHATSGQIKIASVRSKLHKLCDRIDVELNYDVKNGSPYVVITANYARDAFPIVEELVLAAPKIPGLPIKAFKPRLEVGKTYIFNGIEYPLDKVFFVLYTYEFDLGIEIYADLENIDEHVIWALCQDLLGEYEIVFGFRYMEILDLTDQPDGLTVHHISELFGHVDDYHRLDID